MTKTAWAVFVSLFLVWGCGRGSGDQQEESRLPARVTFNEHVAPILYSRCATCHRPIDGSAAAQRPAGADPLCVAGAPFSVLTYQDVRSRASAIRAAVIRRAMPPWLPEAGSGAFLDERRLSDREIALLQAWADAGAPEGDPARRPTPPAFPPNGWRLGTPDLVVTAAEAYTLQPGTRDVFRNFVLPVPPTGRPYVRAVEFRAANERAIHHANIGVDGRRASRRLDRSDPGPGFAAMVDDGVRNVYGWSPGKVPVLEPPESAWALGEGSDLVVQLHLIATQTPEEVRPEVGLYLSDTPPTREPIVIKLESKAIDIPAGEAAYVVEDSYVLPVDVEAVSVYPHAHYLARTMEATAALPGGRQVPLLRIGGWDVRWQDQYRYRAPVSLPAGSTVRMRFTYDNSAGNPRNPHRPPQRVRWGSDSTDEMGALWLEVVPRRPEDAAALAGDFYARALRADLAGAELRVRTDPADVAARNELAVKLLQSGRADEARAQLEELLRRAPRDAEARSNLGSVLQSAGRVREAIPSLQEAVRLEPGNDRLRFNLGNGYLAAGRVDDAVRELRRAIALEPENGDAHFNLAMILGPRGQVDEAITHLRRALEIDPQNGDAHRNLAVALGLRGQLDEAIREDQAALRLIPDSAAVRDHLNRLLSARGARVP